MISAMEASQHIVLYTYIIQWNLSNQALNKLESCKKQASNKVPK
jgi:hypothetical protein